VYILKGSSQKSKKMYEGASQVANDATGNIRTVAAFGAEQHVMDLYDAKVRQRLGAF
jgi:ATP-binding cassette subfamily B (MDR/TAP) protein 1